MIKHANKAQINIFSKVMVVLLIIIFSIYNALNCIKLLNLNKETNDFIKQIDVKNNSDYNVLLDEYKKTYKDKSLINKYQQEFESEVHKYSKKNNKSFFAYDRSQNFLKGRNVYSEKYFIKCNSLE